MTAVPLALVAGYGVYLAYTSIVFGWRGVGPGPATAAPSRRLPPFREWLVQAGLGEVSTREFTGVLVLLFLVGSGLGFALFGGFVPPLVVGGFAATFPLASYRNRRRVRRERALESWPRMIEEIRILTGSVGRSIPHALFEVGRRGPTELRPAFDASHREWLISTDFERTIGVLKGALADPTADAVCETLLVAHELGGADLDRRLEALADDRIEDAQYRKDARAKQAGARFGRRFVLIVPVGMALAGMSVGTGRSAYAKPLGQVAVLCGIAMVVACWVWAGRIMRVPDEDRVFYE